MAAKKETIKSETFADYEKKLEDLKAEYEAKCAEIEAEKAAAIEKAKQKEAEYAGKAARLIGDDVIAQLGDWKAIDFEALSLVIAEIQILACDAGAVIEDDVLEHAVERVDAYNSRLHPKKKRPPRKKKPASEPAQPAETPETE